MTHSTRSLLFAAAALVAGANAWPFGKLKNVVTFGDSYTDSTEFIVTGGTTWPEYLADYANLTLFPFAISGATCDNNTTPRLLFPDVKTDELSAYFNLTDHGVSLDPAETLYTLWIGTNDVGVGELITGQAMPNASTVSLAQCSVDVMKILYESGARNFLFQNMVPLDQVPLYQANSYPDRYWTEERNTTEWNIFMKQLVLAGNEISRLLLQVVTPTEFKGATIGYFDSHALFTDIIDNPSDYLNGTAPLNVTGAAVACVFELNESTSESGNCTIAGGPPALGDSPAKDSFLWYDELHPSEQTDRVVAREIAKVINGTSTRWTTFFRG